ncbi:gastrin/cholecystokinin type B receptor-like isoform X1 [Polistes fuscatus]|uniref:gastrin/cholecystokinin type B receptor-like isoform X1 n=1 Tax=Polistes fuscatus TaxID=30207 RepID=UPI001CA90C65|nr:gastrin/cholecystokinin type B receptor-like isoform X1 [Polistes fuscatus]
MSLMEKKNVSSIGDYLSWEDNEYKASVIPYLSGYTNLISNNFNETPTTIVQSSQKNLLEYLIVPLYGIIFFLSIVGNCLVLITLARNKRMRTVTNVYLLNLAVSDLLLGVFCMPFTLLGQMLKNFVFGLTICKLISYFQVVSVSVGVWTLVAISLERYFAICRPLKSRRWQTQFHAYKMIVLVWVLCLIWNVPILIVSQIQNITGGRRKCREVWASIGTERAYNLFSDGMLLLLPLILMTMAYSLIAIKLWRGLKREMTQNFKCQRKLKKSRATSSFTANSTTMKNRKHESNVTIVVKACNSTRVRVPRQTRMDTMMLNHGEESTESKTESVSQLGTKRNCLSSNRTNSNKSRNENSKNSNSSCPLGRQHVIRTNQINKSIESKKKVIRMLFVIVLEFFVCWAPLHVVNTWYLFTPELVYSMVGSTGISLIQLLAYISSCCNPITYCFMNNKFRQAFFGVFHCHRCWRIKWRNSDVPMSTGGKTRKIGNNNEFSGNESTMCLRKTSSLAKTEVVQLLEEKDRA